MAHIFHYAVLATSENRGAQKWIFFSFCTSPCRDRAELERHRRWPARDTHDDLAPGCYLPTAPTLRLEAIRVCLTHAEPARCERRQACATAQPDRSCPDSFRVAFRP